MRNPALADSFSAALSWMCELLSGTAATAVAIIAVALIGVRMLSGMTALQRGTTAILGCFVVFSASTIAQEIVATTTLPTMVSEVAIADDPMPAQPSSPAYLPFDPYAGAAVPLQHEQPTTQ